MNSRSKIKMNHDQITSLLHELGFDTVENLKPLGAGEFNAVFAFDSLQEHYVLKIAPRHDFEVMTYEHQMMSSEVFWYRQISQNTSIRVPKLYVFRKADEKTAFDCLVMERLSGVTMDDFPFSKEEKDATLSQLVKMASQIHDIENSQYGYPQNGLFDNWFDAISSMISQALNDVAKKHRTSRRGEKLLHYVKKNEELLRSVPSRMVNFDLWPSNVLCERKDHQGIQFAWIDPERSFWGDPIADFVCFQFLVPFEKKTEALAAYQGSSKQPFTGTISEQIRYAIMEGYLALIMEVEKYYRYAPLYPGWSRNVIVSKLLYASAFRVLDRT